MGSLPVPTPPNDVQIATAWFAVIALLISL
jgi:hypothetical protein